MVHSNRHAKWKYHWHDSEHAQMEVEKNILRMSPAPFNEWLQSILNDFKDELSLRNISLIFAPDTAIDSMYFDHSQCEIIINNLLTNAYKFSEENSTVTVSTYLEGNGSRIRITVKDEGTGLQKRTSPTYSPVSIKANIACKVQESACHMPNNWSKCMEALSEHKIMKPKERPSFHLTV